jgi:general bacterial porin, GBP family
MKAWICVGALSLGCTAVQAQSSVTLYGLVDDGVEYLNNVGGKSTTLMQSGTWQGSRWGLKGDEDLGGGYRAFFTLENGFDVNTGKLGQGGLEFGRQAFVGISGNNWGSVSLGRQYDFAAYEMYRPENLGRIWGPALDLDNCGQSWRVNNTVRYTSSRIYGFEGGISASPGGQPGSIANQSVWSAGANYINGPLYIGASYTSARDPETSWYDGTVSASSNSLYGAYASAASRFSLSSLGVTYTFPSVTLNAGVTNALFTDGFDNADVRFDTYFLSAQYSVSVPLVLKAYAYYTTSKKYATSSGPDYEQVNLIAEYRLSKRTSVYGGMALMHATDGAVAQLDDESASSNSNQFTARIGVLTRF